MTVGNITDGMTVGNINEGYSVAKSLGIGDGKGKFMARDFIDGNSVGNVDDVIEGNTIGNFMLHYRKFPTEFFVGNSQI